MVTFTAADHARVLAGEITVTWRLWKYAHVRAGRVYSTGFGWIEIDDVRAVRAGDVSDVDALEAGLPSARALVELARSHTGATITEDTLLYRVRFHPAGEPPARPALPLEEIARRLDRFDAASPTGPWTLTALRLIEENPGVVARALAADAGLGRAEFKANVRKLKALGLTISLPVGYELSALGQTYLDSLDA